MVFHEGNTATLKISLNPCYSRKNDQEKAGSGIPIARAFKRTQSLKEGSRR